MRLVLTFAAGMGLVIVPASLIRADDEKPKQERPRLDASFFDRLDFNKDGVITLDEIPEERRERVGRLIEQLDKNKDGKVTREEFQAGAETVRSKVGRPGADKPRTEGDKPRTDAAKPRTDGDKPRTDAAKPRPDAAKPRPDGDKPRPGTPDRPAGRPQGPDLFRRLDTNGDGKLSRDELAKAAEVLMSLDRDGDGYLSPQELFEGLRPGQGPNPAGVPGPLGERPVAEILKRFDKDGDGKLSKDEAPERMRDRFAEIDANKDGFIDATELRQMMANFNPGQTVPPGARRPDGGAVPSPEKLRGEADIKANRERVAAMLREHDKDADGRISRAEFPERRSDEDFKKLDLNGDGYLTPDELAKGLGPRGEGPGTGAKAAEKKEKGKDGKGESTPEKKPKQ